MMESIRVSGNQEMRLENIGIYQITFSFRME